MMVLHCILVASELQAREEILKYKPRITLVEGLTETIEHYRNNLDRYKVYQFRESEIASNF